MSDLARELVPLAEWMFPCLGLVMVVGVEGLIFLPF